MIVILPILRLRRYADSSSTLPPLAPTLSSRYVLHYAHYTGYSEIHEKILGRVKKECDSHVGDKRDFTSEISGWLKTNRADSESEAESHPSLARAREIKPGLQSAVSLARSNQSSRGVAREQHDGLRRRGGGREREA